MSKLSAALQAAQPGLSRLRSGGGGMGYRAATTQAEGVRPSLLDSVMRFAKAGADMYQAKEQRQRDLADERSNEIIRKLTPEQRRKALNNGTLLYQDDQYAMQALRVKSGRNAAYLVDDEVMQKVRMGHFRSREEMEEYRHQRLQEGAKSYAESFGIDPDDADFQRGFNGDITERNISLYGAHDNFLSEQAQKGAIVNNRVELNAVLNDPELLRRPDSGHFFEAWMNNNLASGAIPSDAQATQLISQSFSDISNRAGGADFLLQVENKKVTLNGATSTYRELLGDEQWNALMVNAQKSQFENDAKLNEKYRLQINSALNQDDPRQSWEMLQGIKEELDKIQPDEQMTPQREWLISAQTQVQDKMRAWTDAQAKALDDAQKSLNKRAVIDAQFEKRMAGQWVSTDIKDMPTNENTGEFKRSDLVNYASAKLAEIDQMQIPDGAKDRLKLKYLRADSKDGAFRSAFGTMVTDASQEWYSAVINGKMPNETPALDALRRVRNADPQLMAALYPDAAELFLTMDMMDRQGIDAQVLLDADRLVATRSKEQRFEDDKAFESALNSSTAAEIARMPASLRDSARKIYDSVKYRSGNENMAMEQMTKFLQESTYTFESEDVESGTIGVIPKNMMQVSDDPKSWEQGRDILEEARKGIIAQNPWITNQQLTMYAQGESIYMMDTTGEVRIRYDKELLTKVWQENSRRAEEKAREEALAKTNKRAPIAAVNKAKETARKRAEEKRKRTPKWIYRKPPEGEQ